MCRGVLHVPCLASLVFVVASMTVCELALFGTLNLTIPKWTDAWKDSRM